MKPIKLTQSSIQKAKEELLSQLDGLKLQGTKVNFSYDFAEMLKNQLEDSTIKPPIIYMMANTYLKMLQYVLKCDTEIAWHGTVKRGEGDKKHLFYIKDVYLYPQKIAAATVQVDDDKYTQWSDKQDNETFNNRRFQGHSHVNMGAFYSGTDQDNKNAFLQDLLDDDFYIFVVMNKRQEMNWELYDLAQNIIFEHKDIDFRVYLDKDTLLDTITNEISVHCTKPTYSHPSAFGTYQGNTYGMQQFQEPERQGCRPREMPYDFGSREHLQAIENEKKDACNDYWNQALGKKEKKTSVKIKRHVVLMNRAGRNFETEHREFEGERINIRFNGQNYEVFVPYKPFAPFDIYELRKIGWHVREMPIPEDFNI